MKHPAIRYTLAIVLGGLALWWAFKGQDFPTLWFEMKKASMWVILAGVGVMFASHLVRSWRWKMFLKPMKEDVKVSSAFRALVAAYGVNKVIPRSGDVVRPLVFWKREGVPLSGTIASIIIERLADLIGLSFALSLCFILFLPDIRAGFPELADAYILVLSGCSLAFIFGVVVLFSEQRTVKIIHFLTQKLPERFRLMVERAAFSFAKGLHHARTASLLPLIFGTLGIWLLYAGSLWVSLYAFDDPKLLAIGFKGCILLQALSGVAMLVPTPGGAGSYHAFITEALALVFGVDRTVALSYATLTHAANYIITALIGIGFLLAEGVSFKDLGAASKGKTTEDMQKAGVNVEALGGEVQGSKVI